MNSEADNWKKEFLKILNIYQQDVWGFFSFWIVEQK